MKRVKVVVGIIILIICAYLYAHIAKTNIIYDKNVNSNQYLQAVPADGIVEQEFVCKEETLDGVAVKVQVIGEDTGSVIATVIEADTNRIVATTQLPLSSIKASKFNTFSFETVKECKNKTYRVRFESNGGVEKDGTGISFFYQPYSEQQTRLSIDEQTTDGTLIMKAVTNRFDLETFCVLLILLLYVICFIKFLYKLFAK